MQTHTYLKLHFFYAIRVLFSPLVTDSRSSRQKSGFGKSLGNGGILYLIQNKVNNDFLSYYNS